MCVCEYVNVLSSAFTSRGQIQLINHYNNIIGEKVLQEWSSQRYIVDFPLAFSSLAREATSKLTSFTDIYHCAIYNRTS